jgi:hypothetical protein
MLQLGDPRRTILVEARKDRAPAAMLDAMADECQRLGHRVVRWRGPLSGRMPYGRWLPPCEIAVLFNGAHRSYRPAVARLRARGTATIFVELGWYPQAGHYQVDPLGVNAAASWATEPLACEGKTPVAVRAAGDLLLLLQLNDDTQITERSPWFANMEVLVSFICQHSRLPVRVRPHPLDRQKLALRRLVEMSGGIWDAAETLAHSLASAKVVACINSSAAVEAMAQGLPVLCYGEAIYRHEGGVYCLDNCAEKTEQTTGQLQRGECSLHAEKMAAIVDRILQRQWTLDDVPRRLSHLFESLPTFERPSTALLHSSDRIEQTICWLADLPARLLYRKRLRRSRETA